MIEYTVCITSCERHDLLEKTCASLVLDIPPKEIFICEDGTAPVPYPEFPGMWGGMEGRHRVTIITKEKRLGQLDSADRLMQQVSTPYVLWVEDDWEFSEPVSAWLPQCVEILENHPEISTVSLRHTDCNGHPLVKDPRFPFQIQQPGWANGFGGFNFNPGLRRLSDYQKMGTYASIAGAQTTGCVNEANISKAYLSAGYRIADLGRIVVRHTGHGRTKSKDKF